MDSATRAGLCTYARTGGERREEVNERFSFPFQEQPRRGGRETLTQKSQTKHGESGAGGWRGGEGGWEVPSVRKVPEGYLDGNSSPVGGLQPTDSKHLARGHIRDENSTPHKKIFRARAGGGQSSVD